MLYDFDPTTSPKKSGKTPVKQEHDRGIRREASGDSGGYCMSSVQIRDVRKSFGGFEVLHGVSIPIEDGAFVVLVGPSGCGKSTLLRMLAGLENITSGTISIGDRVVNNVQPKERDIAMVFQNYALYPHMTVADNMGFSLKLRGASADEISKGVNARRRNPGADAAARPLSPAIVRRPAPARRDGPRHRARSAGVPVRRAACPTSTPSCAWRCAPKSRNCISG